jgi:hypothetical protein
MVNTNKVAFLPQNGSLMCLSVTPVSLWVFLKMVDSLGGLSVFNP